jgi:ketosteroid isomerase-like protein
MDAESLPDRRSAMSATSEPRPAIGPTIPNDAADEASISALDLEFQRAVKVNDAATMDRILHDRYWLILGDGTVVTRQQLLDEARAQTTEYDVQDEVPGTQSVRVWGDTGVVTAKLQIKGRRNGQAFSRALWFSDTYVRTASGWKYAFAQASLALPGE